MVLLRTPSMGSVLQHAAEVSCIADERIESNLTLYLPQSDMFMEPTKVSMALREHKHYRFTKLSDAQSKVIFYFELSSSLSLIRILFPLYPTIITGSLKSVATKLLLRMIITMRIVEKRRRVSQISFVVHSVKWGATKNVFQVC